MKLGRYEILEELGRGAMGAVFLARDPVIDRTVAIKTILASGLSPGDDEGYRKRFFREAQAAGKLSHPGIVTIHDIGEEESTRTPYIVMEYIAGKTLQQLVSESPGVLPLEAALDLVKQVAQALDYAHARGIVHRDIKPANIIVTPEGRAKITDFGVARLRVTQMTVAGEVLGTPSYMAPEQFEGDRTDGRSDLFSLGVILYWLASGERPFAGDDVSQVMFKVVYKDPPPPTEVNPRLPAEFNIVLSRVLAKDPDRRYQSGSELADDLEDLLQRRAPRSLSRAPEKPEPMPEKTAVVPPRERASERVAASERTIPLKSPSESSIAPPARPVVAVDWVRVSEYLKRAGRTAVALSLLLWAGAVRLGVFLGKGGVAFARTLPRHSRTTATLARRGWTRVRALPRRTQVILAVAGVVAVVAILASSLGVALAPKTAVYLALRHDLRSGEFSIWADGSRIASGDLTGREVRRFGVLRRVEGSFSSTLSMPTGKRVVRVRVTSSDGAFNQSREIEAEFIEGEGKTLYVTCDSSRGSLTLALR